MARYPASSSRSVFPAVQARLVLVAVVVALAAAVNLFLAGRSVGLILDGEPAVDWIQYVEAARRVGTPRLYEVSNDYAYRYSPLLAYPFGPLSVLGTAGWRLLHIVAALALPTWPLRALTLVSWPFWYDVQTGNVLVFVLLAGAWALRGSRVGIGSYLLMAILVPRPLMIPLAAWLLWKQPSWRAPFVAALAVQWLGAGALGLIDDWIGTLIAAGEDVLLPSNVGPSRLIGAVPWLFVGLPLAAWLTWRGRVGLASLAASPYWLPYYLLVPLLDLARWRPSGLPWKTR